MDYQINRKHKLNNKKDLLLYSNFKKMEYKELLEILRDNFPKEHIRIHEEKYINTNYPLIYIKPKTYSIEIKNQRTGTITIPNKWQLKLPTESVHSNILHIPDQNPKEFITIAVKKLLEYESLQLQWNIFHTSVNDLKTNPQAQIRNFKLKQLI